MTRRSWLLAAILTLAATASGTWALTHLPQGRRVLRRAASEMCCHSAMLLAQEYLRALNSGDASQLARLSTDTALVRHAQAFAFRIAGTLSASTGERATFYGGRLSGRPGEIAVVVAYPARSMQSFCYLPGEGDELQLTVRDTPAGLRVAHIGLAPC